MRVGVLPACLSVHHMPLWCRGVQKRALDPLELKILTSVRCLVSAGNCTLEEHLGPLITQLLPSSHNGYLFVCLF